MYLKDRNNNLHNSLKVSCVSNKLFPGSSVPSAVVLFLMRELPPPLVINTRREESTTITFIHDDSVTATQQQSWTRATQNQVLMLGHAYDNG